MRSARSSRRSLVVAVLATGAVLLGAAGAGASQVVVLPSDAVVEAQGPDGAVLEYEAYAINPAGRRRPLNCDVRSGSTFSLGVTTVNCRTPGDGEEEARGTFVVTVVDTTPPSLNGLADVDAEASGPLGAAVSFFPTAHDVVDGPVPVVCVPGTGALFPLGVTRVECRASDASGNVSSPGSFTVSVADTTPPAFGEVRDLVREADGPAGSVVTFALPTAVDAVDGPVPVTCAPAPGSQFALGATTVTCRARDAGGNTATATFAVVVRDTTPPLLFAPPELVLQTGDGSPVPVTHPAVAAFLAGARTSDLVSARPTIGHDAPDRLPVGTTTVVFTATDDAGNTSRATSRIVVQHRPGAPPAPAPPPQTQPDTTPPGNVAGLRATPGNRSVTLVWRPPPDADFDHVLVYRSLGGEEPSAATVVYRGNAVRFVDRGLANGTEYRYVVVSFDRSRNPSRGVAIAVTPRLPMLLTPVGGARVTGRPVLTWRAAPGATYYNVQLYRNGRKVLTAWPVGRRLVLPAQWRNAGRRETLQPGTYRWYVWPGIGPRARAQYGELLGESTFTLAAPPRR